MFRIVLKQGFIIFLIFCIFCFRNVFSETGGLKDRPVSFVFVCKPSFGADKPRYYRSTSLFFKRLKNKRVQENGTAFFVGYGSFSSELPVEQLNLAGQKGYDFYIFSKTVSENLPTSINSVLPWIGFFSEKKENVKPEKNTKSFFKKNKNRKSKAGKLKKSKQRFLNGSKESNSENSSKVKKAESSKPQETPQTTSAQTTSPTANDKIQNDSFELTFDSLKFRFSNNTNPIEFPRVGERILFLAGDKTAEEWSSSLSEKTEGMTFIRLLDFPQDLRFEDGIYYTGCASPRIPNGVSVLNFFFRGNRLIRLKQESFSLNSDGSGKSWELE
ncbi:hypothetical protein LEP1GSC060_0993 [Leptospira weilii serovar Ranarum str. ICFT]|uniref:Uncharacterized protein n=1 Tax=Leptospira weilii serovar Ranarum str. ICFT TaxID=1218598 RepID=N1WTE8_9LEPT|nr:hypothetical protein [Leptospira weilii]EMY79133.1 hypothetical protein LEP1GSC060_0993 [Leptospira weilii serovar Ranarum str. ICFT]